MKGGAHNNLVWIVEVCARHACCLDIKDKEGFICLLDIGPVNDRLFDHLDSLLLFKVFGRAVLFVSGLRGDGLEMGGDFVERVVRMGRLGGSGRPVLGPDGNKGEQDNKGGYESVEKELLGKNRELEGHNEGGGHRGDGGSAELSRRT